jgi:hypothetical protein
MPCQQHKLTVFPSQLVPFKKGNTYIKHTIEAFPWPEAYASARIAHDMYINLQASGRIENLNQVIIFRKLRD